uniref:uncharacterized protein LOC122603057 n=1 Tax=Erigeron canadensis TaxID=72917 RepID=UPI001CB8C948|nr:uncharacterized protein LOC122603057 [Erigeron canadensis]
MILLELPKLTILRINECDLLKHVFTSSTLKSLKQLEELTVEDCKTMKVIVKEDDLKENEEHTTSEVVVFPQLKSLTLIDLPSVEGFFLGMNEFQWPQLENVQIFGCPQMMVFTSGQSITPKLNYMHTGLGRHSLECGLNFQLTNESNELLQYPRSFSNLVEVDTKLYPQSLESRIFFPHSELHKLQNLEKLNIISSRYSSPQILILTEQVFEETNNNSNEAQSVLLFPKLKEVTLERLQRVKHIWKSNRRIVLNFPNLTKVSIDNCPLLGNAFTSCMIGSLSQLQELRISDCKNMEVIVKQVEEDSDTRANEVVTFPCLKSIALLSLENLKGFYLGLEGFDWPSLDTLKIKGCPQIMVFTSGQSTTRELKMIDTSFGLCYATEDPTGLCYATEDPTSFIKTKQQEFNGTNQLVKSGRETKQFGSYRISLIMCFRTGAGGFDACDISDPKLNLAGGS